MEELELSAFVDFGVFVIFFFFFSPTLVSEAFTTIYHGTTRPMMLRLACLPIAGSHYSTM